MREKTEFYKRKRSEMALVALMRCGYFEKGKKDAKVR